MRAATTISALRDSLLLWRFLIAGFFLAAFMLASGPSSADEWPTTGGEPGKIIEVTTLADSGAGSLRAAIQSGGRRKIVFKVAGEIWLQSWLQIRSPFVTVAGETAPSPGITLMGDMVRIRTHDVVLRHIRIRVGALPTGTDPQNRDGIAIDGSADGNDPAYNILVENCSVSWSVDELVQIWGKNNHDIVVRRSILAEGLNNSIHPEGAHSAGLMVGPDTRNVLIQGNLFAHNGNRNPVVHGGAQAVVMNNLIYDPGFSAVHFYPHAGSGPTLASVVGNAVIAGPSTGKTHLYSFSLGLNDGSEILYQDNVSEGVTAFTPENIGKTSTPVPFVSEPPVWSPVVEVNSAVDVQNDVLTNAGARPWDRDEVDARIIAEVTARTGQIRDDPTDPRLAATP